VVGLALLFVALVGTAGFHTWKAGLAGFLYMVVTTFTTVGYRRHRCRRRTLFNSPAAWRGLVFWASGPGQAL
jgi:hypothetical protein